MSDTEKKVEVPVMEVSKTNGSRKTAPKGIVIKGEVGKGIVSELQGKYPKKNFVNASPGSSDASLLSNGLIPVKREDGSNVLRKGVIICEQVGPERSKEIQEQCDVATAQIESVRAFEDKESGVKSSEDVTAKRRKPKKVN
jgi:hypothetical protein